MPLQRLPDQGRITWAIVMLEVLLRGQNEFASVLLVLAFGHNFWNNVDLGVYLPVLWFVSNALIYLLHNLNSFAIGGNVY